jgi:hypothetical protein
VQNLLTGVAFYLWTDGKIGGYVRFVADAQRFGSHDEPVIEEHYVALGDDAYVCPECGAEQEVAQASACGVAAGDSQSAGGKNGGGDGVASGAARGSDADENPQAEACATSALRRRPRTAGTID